MMYEFVQAGELRGEARRLLRYRFPLILAVLVNFVFLVRMPIAGMRAETAPPQKVRDDRPGAHGPHRPAQRRGAVPASTPQTRTSRSHRPRPPPRCAEQTRPADTPPSPRSAGVSPFSFTSAWGPTGQRLFARWSTPLRQSDPAATPPVDATPERRRPLRSRSPRLSGARTSSASHDLTATLPASQPASPPTGVASPPTGLTIRNALENEGPVSFLVNGRVCELQPGEAHEFAAGTSWTVQFHRGESFGNAEQTLAPGVFRFVVTDQGWDLEAAR